MFVSVLTILGNSVTNCGNGRHTVPGNGFRNTLMNMQAAAFFAVSEPSSSISLIGCCHHL